MPLYEYHCVDCEFDFEQYLTTSEAKEFEKSFPCPKCKANAEKLSVYAVSAAFGGKPGSSGFHDVDYPVLDKAVGRSATKKWEQIHKEQAVRDRVRKETGSTALTHDGAKYTPTSNETLQVREKAFTKLNEVQSTKK